MKVGNNQTKGLVMRINGFCLFMAMAAGFMLVRIANGQEYVMKPQDTFLEDARSEMIELHFRHERLIDRQRFLEKRAANLANTANERDKARKRLAKIASSLSAIKKRMAYLDYITDGHVVIPDASAAFPTAVHH